MEDLRRIVEPIFYRDRLLLPKLVVTAAGDEFFLPDASRLYFGKLGGEKHLRVIPNTGHSLGATDAWETVLAFYGALVNREPRPAWSWTIREDGSIEARSEKERPERVRLWQATNEQARDFRLTTMGRSWRGEDIGPSAPGVYEARLEPPPRGWTAFFIEATFARAGSAPFVLTTEVSVVPRRYPFAWKGAGEGARHD
jgi:PhoPQ-activated pathogenicity-related protein